MLELESRILIINVLFAFKRNIFVSKNDPEMQLIVWIYKFVLFHRSIHSADEWQSLYDSQQQRQEAESRAWNELLKVSARILETMHKTLRNITTEVQQSWRDDTHSVRGCSGFVVVLMFLQNILCEKICRVHQILLYSCKKNVNERFLYLITSKF